MSTDDMRVMLEECRDRLEGLIGAYRDEYEGLSEYFGHHGAEHSDPDCPEDDTCDCPESRKLHAAWLRFGREVELAHRRIDKIKRALVEHLPPNQGLDGQGVNDGK